MAKSADDLLRLQHADGGWSATEYLESDAYPTGRALWALQTAAALSADSGACRRGVNFDPNGPNPGQAGGVAHTGFRLLDPTDIDQAVAEVEKAGGKLLRRGEFSPGYPYAYVSDPDGYEVEIWLE